MRHMDDFHPEDELLPRETPLFLGEDDELAPLEETEDDELNAFGMHIEEDEEVF